MQSFDEFKISNQLHSAITDLGYTIPTPIQSQAFPVIASGKDVLGIAQTGTGKTFWCKVLHNTMVSMKKNSTFIRAVDLAIVLIPE